MSVSMPVMINGSDGIFDHLKQRLGVKGFGEVTPDGKFSIKEVECLGACGGAPMMQIGHSYYLQKMFPSAEETGTARKFTPSNVIVVPPLVIARAGVIALTSARAATVSRLK